MTNQLGKQRVFNTTASLRQTWRDLLAAWQWTFHWKHEYT